MRLAFAAVLLFCFSALGFAAQTTVSDNVNISQGVAATSITISWPAFTASDGTVVTASSTTVSVDQFGNFSVALSPSIGTATQYSVSFNLANGSHKNDSWVVPVSSQPVTISQCHLSDKSAKTGGSAASSLPNPSLASFAPKTFSMIGDSRTAQLNVAQGDITSITGWQWFNVANAINGHNMLLIGNYGISGDRSDQFLGINLAAALADSSEVLIFNSPCVNDFGQAQTGYTSTYGPYIGTAVTSANVALVCYSNVTQAAAQAIAVGKRVIMVSEPGAVSLNTASIGAVFEFNQRLREWVERTRGAMYFDLASVLWAPTSSSSAIAFKTGYSLDGTHPNTLGGYYGGKAFAAFISSLIPQYDTRPTSILDYATNTNTQLITNPLFSTLTGGTKGSGCTITGNVPLNFIIGGCAVGSTNVSISSAADAAGFGNDITLTITTSAADTVTIAYNPAVTAWNIGDILQGSMDVSVAAGSSNMYLGLSSQATLSGGGNANTWDMYGSTAEGPGPTEAYTYHLKTIPDVVPNAGTKSWYYQILSINFTAAGSATVTASRPSLRRGFVLFQ